MRLAPTRYARSGDARIAYQVAGEGVDLVTFGGPASHLDLQWEEPTIARTLRRYESFARVVRFDRRGTGLSDPVEEAPTLEQQMDDLRAVMDAAGLERAALFGAVEAGLSALFTATYPERVTALVLANVAPAGGLILTEERRAEMLEMIEDHWGEGRFLPLFAPSRVGDKEFEAWWARFERGVMSPSMARMAVDLNARSDLRGVLPTIRVPTLVLHQSDNALVPPELGRELASLIPGARFEEFPGTDTVFWPDADSPAIDLIEEFLTGRRSAREPRRILSTVLFTDIVGSTDRAAEIGDSAWRELLDRHNQLVRAQLESWRGREVKTLGDGFIATFDGPARAVHCARTIVDRVTDLGLEVRAGLHTGECEELDGDVAGIAVHIGARIADMAGGGEVLVSSTVKDLVVGSELDFVERGVHPLRGVPGEWRIYAVAG